MAPKSADRAANPADVAGSLAVLFAAACWGTSGVFVKLIASEQQVSALALAFWRDLITASVLMLGLGLVQPRWLRVDRRDLRWLVGLGVSLGVFHVCWNQGVYLSGAAVATVQQAAMPAIVAVAARGLWQEPLTWGKIVAIALTFLGTVLVSGLDVFGKLAVSPTALLIGLGIPITYAGWNLFGKQARRRCNPFTTLAYAFAFAALVLTPFQWASPQPWPVAPRTWLWVSGLVLIASLLPFTIYTRALGQLPASVATILAMSEIAFVAVYAYVFLGERLTASQILGAGLVMGGVLQLSWSRWRQGVSDARQ